MGPPDRLAGWMIPSASPLTFTADCPPRDPAPEGAEEHALRDGFHGGSLRL
jgi:hypothetical protein